MINTNNRCLVAAVQGFVSGYYGLTKRSPYGFFTPHLHNIWLNQFERGKGDLGFGRNKERTEAINKMLEMFFEKPI